MGDKEGIERVSLESTLKALPGEAGDKHERKQHNAWPCTSQTQHSGDQDPINVGLAKRRGDRETTDEKHYRR